MEQFKTVMLIGEEDIKRYGYLDNNISIKTLIPSILTVQDMVLQPILGSKLYDDIRLNVLNDTLSTEYSKLLDEYIYNVLVYNVLSDIMLSISFKVKNLGVIQTNGDNITNTSLNDTMVMYNNYKSKGDFFETQLVNYLCYNSTLYPYYTISQDGNGMYPTKNTVSNPIFCSNKSKIMRNYDK